MRDGGPVASYRMYGDLYCCSIVYIIGHIAIDSQKIMLKAFKKKGSYYDLPSMGSVFTIKKPPKIGGKTKI